MVEIAGGRQSGLRRIRNEDIALVRERSPIAEIVGEYVDLIEIDGRDPRGRCPFHDVPRIGMTVSPSSGLWFCHGCSAGGGVITFIERIERLSFAEAMERLATKAGVELGIL